MSNMQFQHQQTGHGPVSFTGTKLAEHQEMLIREKRGTRIALYREKDGALRVETQYITTWGNERPYTHVQRVPAASAAAQMEIASRLVRDLAPSLLPPGAGYPATAGVRDTADEVQGARGRHWPWTA